MAELRKIDYENISVKCKDDQYKDYIPSNWYIPARKAWEVFAWAMIQLRIGSTIRTDKEVDRFIHKYWEYIEDRAVAIGEEKSNETTESNNL